ncbi:hypothetical protein EYF80_064142 [Liparis tanakae]|uniref:Uncharacterized protein n=1 Tax=Liparis tanakae TaxID=230148 RepID=A0A4Z2EA58_9TELE|nr:hypothetical protein EYF80_064142 [Liparis tanakae]
MDRENSTEKKAFSGDGSASAQQQQQQQQQQGRPCWCPEIGCGHRAVGLTPPSAARLLMEGE